MNDQNYTTTFSVDQSPDNVFAAINDVRGWWTGDIVGSTDELGSEFTYRYEDIHRSTQKITELVPGRKVVWHVVASQLNFTKDVSEWTGTDIIFDIVRHNDKTEVRFTHRGLVPDFECFESCSGGWRFYIDGNLRKFIPPGRTPPPPKNPPRHPPGPPGRPGAGRGGGPPHQTPGGRARPPPPPPPPPPPGYFPSTSSIQLRTSRQSVMRIGRPWLPSSKRTKRIGYPGAALRTLL